MAHKHILINPINIKKKQNQQNKSIKENILAVHIKADDPKSFKNTWTKQKQDIKKYYNNKSIILGGKNHDIQENKLLSQ